MVLDEPAKPGPNGPAEPRRPGGPAELPDLDLAWHYARLIGSRRAVEAALIWLGGPDAIIRRIAFEVLGGAAIGDASARQALLAHAAAGTDDAEVKVREAVARALLAQVGDPRCVPLLLVLLDDPDAEVRGHVGAGLEVALRRASAADPAVLALVGLLADPAPKVREAAAQTLGVRLGVDSIAIREGLHRLLDEPDSGLADPAGAAAVGLARRGDPDVQAAVADRLRRPRPTVRWVHAAAVLGDPRLLPGLHTLSVRAGGPALTGALDEAIRRCS
jgi:HEAT repeat protein